MSQHLIAIRAIEYINNSFHIFGTILHENIRKTITITVSDFAPYLFVNLNDTFKDNSKLTRYEADKLINILKTHKELKYAIFKTEFVKKKLAYGFDFDQERDFIKIYLKNYEYSKKKLANILTSINSDFPQFTLRTYNDDISAQALFLLETNLKYHTVYNINLESLNPTTINQFTTHLSFETTTQHISNLTPSQDKLFLPIHIMTIRSAISTPNNTAPSLDLHFIEPIIAISADFYIKDALEPNQTIHKLRINTLPITNNELKFHEQTHEPNESYTIINQPANSIQTLIDHIQLHDPDIILFLRDNIEDMAHIITRYPEGQFSRIIGTASTCNKSPMKDTRTIKIPGRNIIDLSSFLPKVQVKPNMDAFNLLCMTLHEKFKYPNKKELSIQDHTKYNFSTLPPERTIYELDIQTTIIRRISIHVSIITDILPISTICNLPISTIASGGQTIRVFNVLAKYALHDNLVFNCEQSERPLFTLDSTKFNSFPHIPLPNETLFEEKSHSHDSDSDSEPKKPNKYAKIKHGKVKAVPIKKMPGGFVHKNIPGFYDKYPILLLDFNSLYPTIFIGYNCCTRLYIRSQETLNKILQLDPNAEIMYVNTHENYSVAYVKKINGKELPNIYPKMESELLANRNKVKSLMKQYKEGSDEYNNLDKQQTGNKVIQNAAYGFTNAKLGSFTKHTFLFLLGTITAIGRWLNRRMTRIVYDKFNGITVGGDTDSVFVQVKDATHQIQAKTTNHEEQMKQYFELCETIANTCSEGLPYPVKIGVDGIYMSLIISTRKKCYVAFEYSNPTSFKVKHQGVQYKKRDRAPFVRKNAAQIVELILYNKKQEVKPFITNLLNKLINLEIPKEQFIITQLYKGGEYKNEHQPIITVINSMKTKGLTTYPGDRVSYITTYNPTKKHIYERAEIPDLNNPKQIPDYLHYLKSLESSLEFCFEYVNCGFDWHSLIQSYYIKLQNILTAKATPNPLTNYFSRKSKSLH